MYICIYIYVPVFRRIIGLEKNGFLFFLFKLFILENSILKFLIDGGMLINLNEFLKYSENCFLASYRYSTKCCYYFQVF